MENRHYVGKYNEIVRRCNEIVGRKIYFEAQENEKVTPTQVLEMEKLFKELIETK